MFGTVPKVMWSRCMPPDDVNRIFLTTNCLLGVANLDGERRVVLVETGCGWDGHETSRNHLALEDERALLRGLAEHGWEPSDVTDVVLSHLHLDHAGGATHRTAEGAWVPTFPNARYWVQARELQDALAPSPRARASYLRESVLPLLEAGRVQTVDGDAELLPGLSVRSLPGHNRGHQGIQFEGGGRRILYVGDLIPTRHHLPPTWVMAYDLDVDTCVASRERLLETWCTTEDVLVLSHEVEQPVGRVVRDERGRYRWLPLELR